MNQCTLCACKLFGGWKGEVKGGGGVVDGRGGGPKGERRG